MGVSYRCRKKSSSPLLTELRKCKISKAACQSLLLSGILDKKAKVKLKSTRKKRKSKIYSPDKRITTLPPGYDQCVKLIVFFFLAVIAIQLYYNQ